MNTTILRNSMVKLILVIVLFSWFSSCKKGGSIDLSHDPTFDDIDKSGATPPYNLNVILKGQEEKFDYKKDGIGFVKFRQDNSDHIVNLYTWVFNLLPNHTYLLQRAVNPITDNSCSSTAWLTLGKGLVPQSIHTDIFGYGHEDLWRDLSSVPSGTEFRIHFQIVDSATKAEVLSSDCYSYTVK